MGSAFVITRRTKSGQRRYHVRYRRGGRDARPEHAGTFRRKADADERKLLVSGWLAAGLDPRIELARLSTLAPANTLAQVCDDWLVSRLDLSDGSKRVYRESLKTIGLTKLAALDLRLLTPEVIQDQVAEWAAAGLAPKTIRGHVSVIRQALDFADLEPNPARHRKVRLPSRREVEIEPPSTEEYLWLLGALAPKYRRALVLIEQTGLRVSEAMALEPRDVLTGSSERPPSVRIRPTATKGVRGSRRGRWVPIEPWALALVVEKSLRAPDGKLLPGITADGLRSAMRDACLGRRGLSPHDFRHRRTSLWLAQGVSVREIATRTGHAKTSMTLDTYSHVMPPTEATREDVELATRGGSVVAGAKSQSTKAPPEQGFRVADL